VVGRSYGGGVAIDLALRYPQGVRGLVLLEAAILSLSADALVWEVSLRWRVLAAADEEVTTVGETFIRFVLGGATWEGFPVPIKQMFTGNGPAILAEVTGGFLRVDRAELGTIDVSTLAGCRRPLAGGLPAGHRRHGRREAQQPHAHGRGWAPDQPGRPRGVALPPGPACDTPAACPAGFFDLRDWRSTR
jgi:hypothetical protein